MTTVTPVAPPLSFTLPPVMVCSSEFIFFFWRHEMTNRNNISFDSDCPVTIDDNGENYITLSNGQQASAGRTLKTLGNLTQKSNEPIINAIMRQAERNGLMESVGFPNRTTWLKDKMPGWFSPGGILDG